MDIRPYQTSDRQACLEVLDSNAPERGSFERFLDQPEGAYLVMEHEGSIVGCGGYVVAAGESEASLVWGMVRRDLQKLGLGRFLLMYRLREIGKLEGIRTVRLEAPPAAVPFFEKQGFRIVAESPAGVEMVKKMAVC